MVAARAALRNGSTLLRCVEPNPSAVLQRGFPGLHEVIVREVQDLPLSEFDQLREGDILFVDSTHVSKFGSDVNHLVLRVLPRLHRGVLVHFHDIFFPAEYPRRWVSDLKIFYNEQYPVQAFMLHNQEYQFLLSNWYLGANYPDDVRKAFPFSPVIGGGSLWLQRTGSTK